MEDPVTKQLDVVKAAVAILLMCAGLATALPASKIRTVASFDGPDGINPVASIVQGAGRSFYGTTFNGGDSANCYQGCGTIFKVTAGGRVTRLYSFCGQTGCPDGSNPTGLVHATDGNFYGTTTNGGSANCASFPSGCGTVFKITPTGKLKTLYSFCGKTNCPDGFQPSPLIQATDGAFYGATYYGSQGAPYSYGTVFKITAGGKLTTLYSFCTHAPCTDGTYPSGGLIQAKDGNFYGTTAYGGTNCTNQSGCGTIFKMTSTGKLTSLYSFCPASDCSGSAGPSGLVQARDGNFYGTTFYEGTCVDAAGCGTVFKSTPRGKLTTLYNFCAQTNCTDGKYPIDGLVQATDGNLYGTTWYGGIYRGVGTVFKITPVGELTTVDSFDGSDGALPSSPIIQASDGSMYGTATYGGDYGDGTIFRFHLGTGSLRGDGNYHRGSWNLTHHRKVIPRTRR
jgi:uncharacterized repeat protein (TIGR03803 family)